MTSHRDPLRDRLVPDDSLGARARLSTVALEGSPAEVLATFAATVARYLDASSVRVAWGRDGRWVPVTVPVDPAASFCELLREVKALGAEDTAGPLPGFGVATSPVPGPGPALLALTATGAVEYAAGAYAVPEVERFLASFGLVAAARTSDLAIGRLPLVPDADRDLLAPHRAAPGDPTTLVDLVADQVRLRPDTDAVRAGGRTLTYAELWERAGTVARRLPARRPVGVDATRSVDLMVALLAVLRAGSAYVALEPGYPLARLAAMVALADVSCVIAQSRDSERALHSLGRPVLLAEGEAASDGSGPAAPRPEDLAYVMFTSGSTGEPKGVMVEHRHVVNTLRHMEVEPGLRPGEVMLGVTTPAFDLSVPDLFLPLVTGATLAFADPAASRDGARLAAEIADHRPQLMQATPSTWRLLVEAGWRGANDLRVVCGGEAYDADLVRDLLTRTAGVWNFYGPTETAVWSVATRLRSDETDPLPLGRSMLGVDCYLLDSRGEPVPRGVRGEIAIAGAGVARGYLGRDDLTRAAFVPCSFPGALSERMYLTGDLARMDPDGRPRFAGRRDHQVKLNGFRVELGEIEATLRSLPGVTQAVAVVREDQGPPRLVGYVVGFPGVETPDNLRAALVTLLPPQSVPSTVVVVDALPLTANGKLDRARLPAPADRTGLNPAGDLETAVAATVAAVLGLPRCYADDDVFALGADSLMVGRIAIRLSDELGIDVAPGLIFRHPTVAALAGALVLELLDLSPDLLEAFEVGDAP